MNARWPARRTAVCPNPSCPDPSGRQCGVHSGIQVMSAKVKNFLQMFWVSSAYWVRSI